MSDQIDRRPKWHARSPRPAVALVLLGVLALTATAARGQEQGPLAPRKQYLVGLYFKIDGVRAMSPAARKRFIRPLVQSVKHESMVNRDDVSVDANFDLDGYGKWRAADDRDFICYAHIIITGDNTYQLLMRFYYVRGRHNVILPDIKWSGTEHKLQRNFAEIFRRNFPIEALITERHDDGLSLSRGSDASIAKDDRFVPLTPAERWWEVFAQKSMKVTAVDDDYASVAFPETLQDEALEDYAGRLQKGQLLIRCSHDKDNAAYQTHRNRFRIIWKDTGKRIDGARVRFLLGPKPDKPNPWKWQPSAQQLQREDVALDLPRGVPVTIIPELSRGARYIHGDMKSIESWGKLTAEDTILTLGTRQEEVKLVVIPARARVNVKVDGKTRPERPLMLRWGTHRIEVEEKGSHRKRRWMDWHRTINVPLPNNTLSVALKPDYEERVISELTTFYNPVPARGRGRRRAVDPMPHLIEAVRMMEECPPDHSQFIQLRYTVSSVLAEQGYYPEALMAMLKYRQGAGMSGATGASGTVRIVAGDHFSANNRQLPCNWMWEWAGENLEYAKVDRLDILTKLKFPPRASGKALPADETEKIYRYLIGVLLYQYAAGNKQGQPYLSDEIDRSFVNMLAYNYLSAHNWPTMAGEPFLHMTLRYYSRYYRFKILNSLYPIVLKFDKKYYDIEKQIQEIDAKLAGQTGRRTKRRLELHRLKLLFRKKLVDCWWKKNEEKRLRKELDAARRSFLGAAEDIEKSSDYARIADKVKAKLAAMKKEVMGRPGDLLGEEKGVL